jgi:hypothetical protein
MGDITPTTGLSDDDKDYNWKVMMPIIMFIWLAIGTMLCYPNLLIKCCQLTCPKKRPEESLTDDEKTTKKSSLLVRKLSRDLQEKLDDGQENSPSSSLQPNGYNKLNPPATNQKGAYIPLP